MGANQNILQNSARVGLNTDSISEQIATGYITDALNAINTAFDGQQVTYSNEGGSTSCITLPDGYKAIGVANIIQLRQVWYLLTNPATGYSYIGYVAEGSCSFTVVVDDSIPGSDLLGFSIHHPVLKFVVKTTNCGTQFYFTDRYNVRRYFDIDNPPWKDGTSNQLDTNKMAVQPNFRIPIIQPTTLDIGGSLIEGDYQFAIQYANVRGDGLTSFYSVTNPVRIFLDGKVSLDYNLQTNYAINLTITELDITGLYDHFNLAVIKTINGNTTAERVGTYYILNDTYTHVYTGNENADSPDLIQLSEIRLQHEYYDIAGDLTAVDNVIAWADLIKEEDIPYQKIANQVVVYWGSSQVPVGQKLGYEDGVVCANFEGYFGDEVYALELALEFNNGKRSTRNHIPGRLPTAFDLQPVNNADSQAIIEGTCPTPILPRWKVYNTASVIGDLPGSADPCTGIKPWKYGWMGYHESTEVYPSNAFIWGTLAGQPIRHHRFPDSVVAPIHDGQNVYPLGFKIDIQSLYTAIVNSPDLTQEEVRSITGFKIMRSDRAGNQSIIAKGIFTNSGKVAKLDDKGVLQSTYYYSNYPLNDVRPDPFISSVPVENKSGTNAAYLLNDFQRSRFAFYSFDAMWARPAGIQNAFMKLETGEYGSCKAHFVQVENNAGEKLKTRKDLDLAMAIGVLSSLGINVSVATEIGVGAGVTTNISPVVAPQNFFPAFNNMLEIIDKLIPYTNYGWQYNALGTYTSSIPIPNDVGNKIRFIEHGGYVNTGGIQSSFGDDHQINNTFRESSVYVSVNQNLPFTHEQVDTNNLNLGIPQDTSRTTASQAGVCGSSAPIYRNTSVYYGSIKRDLPGQYGAIFSYQPIDTGTQGRFFDTDGNPVNDLPIVYGGDCFITRTGLKIKHSFFLKNTVNKPDGYDIDYNQDGFSRTNTGNVGYPVYYYSTDNIVYGLNSTDYQDLIDAADNMLAQFSTFGVIINILTGGIVGTIALFNLMLKLVQNTMFKSIGLKITNLECYDDDGLYELGQAYLYAYGIPYFFCESEANVDMRQAYNLKEGNFYPNVGTDIPDQWLQETNVPIAQDNTYTYNKTYSKQNRETAFTLLRPDWEPDQTCFIEFNNRAIWSQQSDLEETRNNWLIYKPANLKNFPKNFGPLVAIDALETGSVMVRYTNHTQLYNALAVIETNTINAALGSGTLFSGTPIDITITDTGFLGSQNKFLLNTEHGHIFVDAMRGEIVLVKGPQIEELSGTKYNNNKWFSRNLPFQILQYYPTVPVDNHYNGVGLHGTYDTLYQRLIITKLDYIPLDDSILYDGENFYIEEPETNRKTIVQLTDPEYFCNKSWTMSFSFLSNSWISWHSYLPNFYVPNTNYFQTGYNVGDADVWNNNKSFDVYTSYRGVQSTYILESPYNSPNAYDQILQGVQDYSTPLKYTSFDLYTETDDVVYFNKAVVYNNQQNSGLLELIPKDTSNMYSYMQYPIYDSTKTQILVTKVGHIHNFNMIWDKVIDVNTSQWIENCSPENGNRDLNQSNIDYTVRSYRKYPIKNKNLRVRMILDNRNDIKLLSRFTLVNTQNAVTL